MKRVYVLMLAAILIGSATSALAQGSSVERSAQGPSVVREPATPRTGGDSQAPIAVERSGQEGRRSGSEQSARVVLSPEQLLSIGWERFSAGDWKQAEQAFSQALAAGNADAQMRARLGLGYASLRLGNLPQARENFQKAFDAGYNVQETLPALLTVLKAQGDRETLDRYVQKLPENQRSQWAQIKPIEPARPAEAPESGVRAALAQAGNNPSPSRLQAILSQHAAGLSACADADVYLKIAQGLSGQGQEAQAKPVFARLLSCPKLDFGVRMGAFYDLAAITDPEIVRDSLQRFQENARGLTSRQQQALRDLALMLDKKQMGRTGVPQARRVELARSILNADPADPDARAMLAWDALNQRDFARSLESFRTLAGQYPKREDVQLGLGYSLLQLGRADEALAVVAASGKADDPSMKDLAYQAYVQQAFSAVDAGNYDAAGAFTAKARAIWPDGVQVREAEAWTAYGKGDYVAAYTAFQERYKATGDSRFLSPMVLSLSNSGQRVKAFEAAAQLAQDKNTESNQAAARFYREQNAPILAAQAVKSGGKPDECCANADTQMMDVRGFVRSKTGDSGFSRLIEWTVPAGYSWASQSGWRVGAVIAPSLLNSGSAPANPYAGSYYARVAGVSARHSLLTEATVYTPTLSLDIEGPYLWRLTAGTSPIGGPVSVMPTFSANVSSPTWELQLHQKPVTESMLSWIGQRDPYSSKVWGRVLRSGAQGSYVFTPADNWFLSLGGAAEYLWGENVADNVGLKGTASAGRTFKLADNELALGVFATLKHYSRNLNFYTFGNGGYYSPDLLFIAGPFVRVRSPECRDYWFDLEGSVGYMYERTASAAKYPLAGASAFGLSSAQLEEFAGHYSGKSETKFAYSAKGEALKLLSPYFAAGVFGGLSNAADYREAFGGIGMRVFFDPQKGFWAPKGLFRSYTPLDRDQ
ncbi:MAG: cellulose synthase subunit BcsC-related outer membrane protein [Acidobacteriota bacterium]